MVLTPRCWRQIVDNAARCDDDGDKKPVTGEHEISRNAVVQEMPDRFRRACGDYARMLSIFAYEAAGALTRPAFPAPSLSRDMNFASLGRVLRRGKTDVCVIASVNWRIVIACDKRKAFAQGSVSDEAIQNPDASGILDRFASLAMTDVAGGSAGPLNRNHGTRPTPKV